MIPFSRGFGTELVELFKQTLYETGLNDIEVSQNLHQAYKTFLNKFSNLFDAYFLKKTDQIEN